MSNPRSIRYARAFILFIDGKIWKISVFWCLLLAAKILPWVAVDGMFMQKTFRSHFFNENLHNNTYGFMILLGLCLFYHGIWHGALE